MVSLARIVWRLCKPEYAPGLDGEGARLQGGRWNSPGRPMVYTAESLSLATLEVMVHLPASMRSPEKMPKLQAVALEIPNALVTEALKVGTELTDTRAFGDIWLERKSSLGLIVPSRVIPVENNVVLNPMHPEFGSVRVIRSAPFEFDSRLSD